MNFEVGKAYYFTPCQLSGRERYDHQIIAVANEIEEGRVTFAIVGGVFTVEPSFEFGPASATAEINSLKYFASASVPADLYDAWRVKNAIRQSKSVGGSCGEIL